jgi:zinc protease
MHAPLFALVWLTMTAPKIDIPFERYVLANGLRVILHVDRSSPLVAVNVRYHVGSKDEKPGRTGFAHLFEHLMFMGSKHAPYPSFDALMEAWGGHNNGTTNNDRTNYYEVGPANLLETFLWLEADRLATLPEVISAEELEKQRKVVQNERRQSYENRPYGKAQLLLPEALYPAGHPYRWPTIGSHEDLQAAKVEDVREFFQRFYVPANASIVIAGDFEPAQARALVEKYFGWQPLRPVPAKGTASVPVLARDKLLQAEDRVALPRLYLSWHSPALFAPGDADLDLGAAILGSGKSSRLYRTLVFEKHLAQDVMAYQSSMQLGGQFTIQATAKPGHTLDELARVIDEELARLRTEGPTAEEVEAARNKQLADFYRGIDSLEQRADLLNHYEQLFGDPGGFGRDLARYGAVTPASVKQALARVTGQGKVVLRVTPAKKLATVEKGAP